MNTVVQTENTEQKPLKNAPDIISVMQDEMLTDADSDSKALIRLYEEADSIGRQLIDKVLMAACGWTYNTLKDMAIARGHFVED